MSWSTRRMGPGTCVTHSGSATPWEVSTAEKNEVQPGPGDRRRAGGRRRLLRGSAGRGGGVCWAPPGGDLGAILSGRTKAAGEGLAPPNPHPRGLALNLNLYLTLCPEGGEGTHLS